MKKLLTLTALLFTYLFTFGQKETKLCEKYILKTDQLQDGLRTLEIVELVNSSLYWEVWNKIHNRRVRPSQEDISKSLETIKFTPKEGKYFLNNNYQKFWFTIDKNGLFKDTADFENYKEGKTEYWTFRFENGNVTEVNVTLEKDENPFKKIEANDTLFVTKYLNPKNGNMIKKRVIKNDGDWHKSFVTGYYESGNIKSEDDGINNVQKSFYENGKLNSYENTKTHETINYDEQGRKTSHSYPSKENYWCNESYKNGLITNKNCSNSSQEIQYYYKSGKLDYYEVNDHIKSEMRKYDENNKLISTVKLNYTQTAPN